MNRTLLNIIIDLLATLSFLGMIATGYLLRFPLPPGSNQTHSLWGLTRHEWGDVHFWISVALLVIMLVHLALHWNWIVTVIGKRCGLVKDAHPSLFRCAIWTIVGFAALCVGFVWLVETNLEVIDRPQRGHRFGNRPLHHTEIAVVAPVPESGEQTAKLTWPDIYPIFRRNCLACHGPQGPAAGFRVDSLALLLTADKPWIIAGNPEQSPLLAIVSGERSDMPMADVHRLSETEVASIRLWIEQGASQ